MEGVASGISDPAETEDAIALVRATHLLRAHHYTVLPPPPDGAVLRAGPLRLEVAFRELVYGDRVVLLAPIECRILALVVTAGEAGIGADQLREALWPVRRPVSDPLHVHLSRLREKLAACTGRDDVLRLHRKGYHLTTTDL
jgi:DNA-binding response OmpR family regulator